MPGRRTGQPPQPRPHPRAPEIAGALMLKPHLYVVFREHDPRPNVPWQPPGFPSTCTEVNGTNRPPLWPHEIMTEEEVRSIQASLETEILVACHENGAKAKSARQVELASALPSTTREDIAQWVDVNGDVSVQKYNEWTDRKHGPKTLLDPKLVPIEEFNALKNKIAEMDDRLRSRGLK